MRRRADSKGFSLIEVIVALAMLALVAIPAVGLATMAAKQSKNQLKANRASELKSKIEYALKSEVPIDVFSLSDLPVLGLSLNASEDLTSITTASNSAKDFYEVRLLTPSGYTFQESDPYRIVAYEVSWRDTPSAAFENQLFFTSVFVK